MSGVTAARRAAYETIRAVSTSDAYANLHLPKELRKRGLRGAEAGFATELTYGTLRRQGTYDAVIEIAANRPVSEIDADVRDALRLGVHQLLAMRVPSHAAVHESVELAAETGGKRAAGFANAVLRKVSASTEEEWLDQVSAAARSDDERIGVLTAHPVWIVRAFRRALAAEGRADELEALLAADNSAPEVTLTALPGLASIPADSASTPHSPIGFYAGGGDPLPFITDSEGRVRVQDEGSQLAALALSRAEPVRTGERWLDLCAGPGGKAAVLAAEALIGGAVLEANEVSHTRARLVRGSLIGIPGGVEVSEEDGRTRAGAAQYDRILVDAPCTGLGALRRRPEARWRKLPSDIPELTTLQGELAEAAFAALVPGGILGYVTCSPHLAETAGVVAELKRRFGDEVEELDARAVLNRVSVELLDLPEPADGTGRAQLWPHRHGTDAMSISLLRRRAT